MSERQVFAYSGVLRPDPRRPASGLLTTYPLTLTEQGRRFCYVPTAVGDAAVSIEAKRDWFATHRPDVEFSVLALFPQPSVRDVRRHLLGQDVISVEGGSVVNLMAVWRAHGLREVLGECWESGVVVAGPSAGSLCWHTGGPTDSFGDGLDAFTDGLGLVPFSNGVHDDLAEQPRRETYRAMVADGRLGAGYATEDGVGLHYRGTALHEAVSVLDGARAWWVQPDGAGGVRERPVLPRLL